MHQIPTPSSTKSVLVLCRAYRARVQRVMRTMSSFLAETALTRFKTMRPIVVFYCHRYSLSSSAASLRYRNSNPAKYIQRMEQLLTECGTYIRMISLSLKHRFNLRSDYQMSRKMANSPCLIPPNLHLHVSALALYNASLYMGMSFPSSFGFCLGGSHLTCIAS